MHACITLPILHAEWAMNSIMKMKKWLKNARVKFDYDNFYEGYNNVNFAEKN